MDDNARDIITILLLVYAFFVIRHYKKKNEEEIREDERRHAVFEAAIRDYKLSRDIISKRNVNLEKKLEDVGSKNSETVESLKQELDDANRYNVYKFVIKDEHVDSMYPRSAVVIAESLQDAIIVFRDSMYNLFADENANISDLYDISSVNRNKESVVLVNMDIL